MKKILMVLTSHSSMENTESKTGVWLGEFTDPYYEFIDAGYKITLASPKGGRPPVDPMSELTEHLTGSNRRFQDDEQAKAAFSETTVLDQIRHTEFDAVFYPGGHGPIWDLAVDNNSGLLILDFLDAAKPVAAVCHGPAALISAERQRPGLLKGKIISAFSNAEETLVGRSGNVPYKLQTRLKELGAEVKTALLPFLSHVEADGLLVTGQNPLSAGPTAIALIELLQANTVQKSSLDDGEHQWQQRAETYLNESPGSSNLKIPDHMTQDSKQTNPGEGENNKNMGLPEKDGTDTGINLSASLPSDGPVSLAEASGATDLTTNLEKDDPEHIRTDAGTES
jgi:putative intracellular protease/amidase